MNNEVRLAAMLSEPWNNNACRGYVIYAMEDCGFSSSRRRSVAGKAAAALPHRGSPGTPWHSP